MPQYPPNLSAERVDHILRLSIALVCYYKLIPCYNSNSLVRSLRVDYFEAIQSIDLLDMRNSRYRKGIDREKAALLYTSGIRALCIQLVKSPDWTYPLDHIRLIRDQLSVICLRQAHLKALRAETNDLELLLIHYELI